MVEQLWKVMADYRWTWVRCHRSRCGQLVTVVNLVNVVKWSTGHDITNNDGSLRCGHKRKIHHSYPSLFRACCRILVGS